MAALGLPPIRLHDLRHGASSLALEADVDIKVVQELLGPSSSVLTRDTYTSVSPRLAKEAAERTAACRVATRMRAERAERDGGFSHPSPEALQTNQGATSE